ncbi:hypothetical protein IV203_023307 [Nitzschia inconspicua]|uniref:SPRY domain-containing protein n=1 Tax=Nitzschia inconspicua TaxID=303405 RepID=A0A9K3KDR7_9STRA|nr:hypothetical protein IV203_023307 [Nitzschia inconspicua]
MGCCCSLGSNGEDEAATAARETEMAEQTAKKTLVVSAKMSAPTVKILDGGTTLKGHGLALVATALEQDAAYWEWHVTLPARKHVDTVLFGVTTKKDRQFYKDREGKESTEGESSEEEGTNWMRKVEIQNGDVVGVAVQQSDLPMLQFFHNGEPMYDISINRFRGTVYPAICLPKSAAEELQISAVLLESQFSHMSPAAKFGPIIVARSIV